MPGKLLVTHKSPDLDAITSIWLFRRFLAADYGDAALQFVSAGETLPPEVAAQMGILPSNVVHTDTGLGEFDHHQPDRAERRICASSLVYDHICLIQRDKKLDEALHYIVNYVNAIDHFEDANWPDAADLRYEMMLAGIIDGAKAEGRYDDEGLVHFGSLVLNAVYAELRDEYKAQDVIATHGQTFKIGEFKALALASSNGAVEKRAQKMGYQLVIRKNEEQGHVRVKVNPEVPLDLTPVYKRLLEEDKIGTWFLHGSKHMLLNGSMKNTSQIPTPLSLIQMVKIVKEELAEA